MLSLEIARNTNQTVLITARHTLLHAPFQLLTSTNAGISFQNLGDPETAGGNQHVWTVLNAGPSAIFKVLRITNALAPTVTITEITNVTVDSIPMLQVRAHAVPATNYTNLFVSLSDHEIYYFPGHRISEPSDTNILFQIPLSFCHDGTHQFRVLVQDDNPAAGEDSGFVGYSDLVDYTLTNAIWFADAPGQPEAPGLFCAYSTAFNVTAYVRPEFRSWQWAYIVRDSSNHVAATGPISVSSSDGLIQFDYTFLDGASNVMAPYDQKFAVTFMGFPTIGASLTEPPALTVWTVSGTKNIYAEVIPWATAAANTNAIAVVVGQTQLFYLVDAAYYQAMETIGKAFSTNYWVEPVTNATSYYRFSGDPGAWDAVKDVMAQPEANTFFFFGHVGNGEYIGGSSNRSSRLSSSDVRVLLRNYAPRGENGNSHPYRAAFLVGCLTLRKDGDLASAFLGVPQDRDVDGAWFTTKKLTPRFAFGYKTTKALGVKGTPGGDVDDVFVGASYMISAWAETVPGGFKRTIQQAFDKAVLSPFPTRKNDRFSWDARFLGDTTLRMR